MLPCCSTEPEAKGNKHEWLNQKLPDMKHAACGKSSMQYKSLHQRKCKPAMCTGATDTSQRVHHRTYITPKAS